MPIWAKGTRVLIVSNLECRYGKVAAVRGLSLGTATTSDVVVALLWIAGMLIVFAPLATWRYRRG